MKFLDVPKSGSIAGTTHSRNRNGQYTRSRRAPVQPRTAAQLNVRARQTTNAATWRTITATQQDGWKSLGSQMRRTDALGQSYTLTGFQAFCSVNNVLAQAGSATITDAPALSTPEGLATMTITLAGGGSPAFSVAFTPTPAPTGAKVIIRCSPQSSAGRTFNGDYRIITVSAAAATSPLNVLTSYQAKFGTPVTGNAIFVQGTITLGGFESIPFNVRAIAT